MWNASSAEGTKEEKKTTWGSRFYRLFARISMIATCGGVVFLFFTLLSLVSRLEALAPAEFRFLLQIVKNRFFR